MTYKKWDYRIDLIKKFLFLSFAFFLPLSQKISTINIVLLVVVSLLNIRKEKANFEKEFIALIGLYIIYCLSILYSSEIQLGIIEQKASLMFFPIIFILNKNVKEYYELILKSFVLGCLFALIICELNAFHNSYDYLYLCFDSRIDKSITFYESLTHEKNYFFSYTFSFIHQTVYLAMYLLFAISILFYQKNIFKNVRIKNFIISFLVMGVFQTLNKAAILILFILFALLFYRSLRNKTIAAFGIVFITLVGCLMFVLNPRFETFRETLFESSQEIKIEDFKKINNKNPNRGDFRLMLWDSSIDLIRKNPIIGIGAGGSHNRLYEVFAVKRQWYDKAEKYHAHNEYLQILLDLGIIGFSVFIFLLISFLYRAYKYNDENLKLIAINFALIITINFLFESMFERYSGISFFSFFYCLFISNYSTEERLL